LKQGLTFKTASPGALSLSNNEIIVFGGWDKKGNDQSCILKENADGEYSVVEGNELVSADNFLVNGI